MKAVSLGLKVITLNGFHCSIKYFFLPQQLSRGFQNVSFNGSLLPHLPGSNHGSPDIRMAASNLSLNNAGKKSDPHPHFPTI
jgi:hypothetical protein